ncbi:MAG: hypothetical protein V4629_12600 [Pseudomonadota bacterium]
MSIESLTINHAPSSSSLSFFGRVDEFFSNLKPDHSPRSAIAGNALSPIRQASGKQNFWLSCFACGSSDDEDSADVDANEATFKPLNGSAASPIPSESNHLNQSLNDMKSFPPLAREFDKLDCEQKYSPNSGINALTSTSKRVTFNENVTIHPIFQFKNLIELNAKNYQSVIFQQTIELIDYIFDRKNEILEKVCPNQDIILSNLSAESKKSKKLNEILKIVKDMVDVAVHRCCKKLGIFCGALIKMTHTITDENQESKFNEIANCCAQYSKLIQDKLNLLEASAMEFYKALIKSYFEKEASKTI